MTLEQWLKDALGCVYPCEIDIDRALGRVTIFIEDGESTELEIEVSEIGGWYSYVLTFNGEEVLIGNGHGELKLRDEILAWLQGNTIGSTGLLTEIIK